MRPEPGSPLLALAPDGPQPREPREGVELGRTLVVSGSNMWSTIRAAGAGNPVAAARPVLPVSTVAASATATMAVLPPRRWTLDDRTISDRNTARAPCSQLSSWGWAGAAATVSRSVSPGDATRGRFTMMPSAESRNRARPCDRSRYSFPHLYSVFISGSGAAGRTPARSKEVAAPWPSVARSSSSRRSPR